MVALILYATFRANSGYHASEKSHHDILKGTCAQWCRDQVTYQ